ncbi:MAG: 50S ribosomal protein L6 [Syntrophobacterales bacterium]|jgi:large subunit ribosomal protein L6|nr:50S ribosomal protein L6 [Syntrophobacterales bacterium]
MSRIGKRIIEIPEGVSIKKEGNLVVVQGPKGTLSRVLPREVEIIVETDNKTAHVEKSSAARVADQNQGLARTLVANMVTGVSAGYEKGLEISGVGYRAEVDDNGMLKLAVGYSSPVVYEVPEGISLRVDKQVNIFVAGIDKELVGKVAAEIRSIRKPEPYKGKGIRYAGEVVRKKEGKSAGA